MGRFRKKIKPVQRRTCGRKFPCGKPQCDSIGGVDRDVIERCEQKR
jgi:hypothetical protein